MPALAHSSSSSLHLNIQINRFHLLSAHTIWKGVTGCFGSNLDHCLHFIVIIAIATIDYSTHCDYQCIYKCIFHCAWTDRLARIVFIILSAVKLSLASLCLNFTQDPARRGFIYVQHMYIVQHTRPFIQHTSFILDRPQSHLNLFIRNLTAKLSQLHTGSSQARDHYIRLQLER